MIKEDLIVHLVKMITRIFNQPHIEDVVSIRQRIKPDDKGRKLKIINIFIKKYSGLKREWNEREVIKKIQKEIEGYVGKNIMLDIKSSRGNKLECMGMEKPDESGGVKYIQSDIEREFNYQFEIIIIKRIGRGDNANKKNRKL